VTSVEMLVGRIYLLYVVGAVTVQSTRMHKKLSPYFSVFINIVANLFF